MSMDAEVEEIMNRYARHVLTFGSIIGALALVPVGAAFAQEAPTAQPGHPHGHHNGLLGAALKLDSLTAAQRTAIEALQAQRRESTAPVRTANAQVLTLLAQEVEQGSVDTQALAPALGAERTAAVVERGVQESALNQLHGLLTPSQRGQVVDAVEASWSASQDGDGGRFQRGAKWAAKLGLTEQQKTTIAANLAAERSARASDGGKFVQGARRQALEAFRGDSFDASALARVEHRGERVEKIAQAMVPVLTPAQRATLARGLRAHAARESRS
jgi:Spy/CpxP family protein refolding chaperone